MTTPTTDFDEAARALKTRSAPYVEDDGERWTELIEREHEVPMELWDELRERGYLRLAAPVEYGGARDPVHALPRAARAVLDVARLVADDRSRLPTASGGRWTPTPTRISASGSSSRRSRARSRSRSR